MKKNRIWLNILFVCLILAILLIVIFVKGDSKAILESIKNADAKYLLISIGLIIIFIITTALSLMILVRLRHKINWLDSFNIANCAQFYNGVTPFQSGGQPIQVYYYTKVNIKPNESTSLLMMNFIIHQLVLTILGIIAIIIYFDELFLNSTTLFKIAVIVGLTINFLILTLLIVLSLSKKMKNAFLWLIKGIFHIKPLRSKKEVMVEKANGFFEKGQESFKELFKHLPILLLTIIIKVISLIAYFMVPYFIFKALYVNVDISKMAYIIWMTAFAYVIMSFMPTPGASGGAEWAFQSVFASTFSLVEATTFSALLLWRFLTYYLVMILGAISTLFIKKRKEDEVCELESSPTATSHK